MMCLVVPPGIVTFHRQTLPTGRNWRTSTERLRRLRVSSLGTIEDDGIGMLQVCTLDSNNNEVKEKREKKKGR